MLCMLTQVHIVLHTHAKSRKEDSANTESQSLISKGRVHEHDWVGELAESVPVLMMRIVILADLLVILVPLLPNACLYPKEPTTS